MKEKNNEQINSSISQILSNFKRNLYGVEYYFKKFGGIAETTDASEVVKAEDYFKSCLLDSGIDINNEDKITKIELSSDAINQLVIKLRNKPKISIQNYDILSKSSFLMLNNYFEYLLSDLLSYHYNKYQNSLNEKKFSFTLKEINEYENINELVKASITKEVEAMIVEFTFDELLEHFNTVLGIVKEDKIIDWDIIKECRERRHLIVHNSSLINKKYISRTKNPFSFKLGDTIKIDKDYFYKSCQEFYLAGLLLSYNCWGKWDKNEANQALIDIMTTSFDLLKQGEFLLVSKLTNYAQKIEARNEDQEDTLLRIKFNRLIALKKINDKENLPKEIKKLKVGTASPIFKLAYAIISDNHSNIMALVKQAKAINEIDMEKYLDWPIYEFIRNKPEINDKVIFELNE